MLRKIENIYTYMDYRVLLNDDFMARSHSKPNYSLRAYSRDLDVSVGFLSDILRGQKDLSADRAKAIFERLGFKADELKYTEKMIEIRGSDPVKKSDAEAYLQSHYQGADFHEDGSQDLFLKTGDHYLVYGIARRLAKLREVLYFCSKANILEERCRAILAEFEKANYLRIDDEENIVISDQKLVIKNHKLVFPRIKQFTSELFELLEKNGQIIVPEQVAHSYILGVDKEAADLIWEAQKHFLKNLSRIAEQSKGVDRFVLLSDLSFVIK